MGLRGSLFLRAAGCAGISKGVEAEGFVFTSALSSASSCSRRLMRASTVSAVWAA